MSIKLCYDQSDENAVGINLTFRRGGKLFVGTGDVIAVDSERGLIHAPTLGATLPADDNVFARFTMERGGRPVTLTHPNGKYIVIRYELDKKVCLSGDTQVYLRWNGLEVQEMEEWPEKLVIEGLIIEE